MKITLTHPSFRIVASCSSLLEANGVLQRWSLKTGATRDPMTVHFTLMSEKHGLYFQGAYSIRHVRLDEPDLGEHLRGYFGWVCGQNRPASCSPEKYEKDIAAFPASMRERAATFRIAIDSILAEEAMAPSFRDECLVESA